MTSSSRDPLSALLGSFRLRPAQLAAITCLFIVVGLVHLSTVSVVGPAVRNSLHAPGFLMATILVHLALNGFRRGDRFLMGVAASVALAVFSEALQAVGPGDASLADLANNMVGIGAGTGIVALAWVRLLSIRGVLLMSISLTLSLIAIHEPTAILRDHIQRKSSFPDLFVPGASWTSRFIIPQHGAYAVATQPADGFRFGLGTQQYSGLRILPYGNWKGFEKLQMTLQAADGCEVNLTISIHDIDSGNSYGERFNFHFLLRGRSTYEMALDDISKKPQNRNLDLRQIDRMFLFQDPPTDDCEVTLLNLSVH